MAWFVMWAALPAGVYLAARPASATASVFWKIVIGMGRLWGLSRTPSPSLLDLWAPGHYLVSRRSSSGEEQLSASALRIEQ